MASDDSTPLATSTSNGNTLHQPRARKPQSPFPLHGFQQPPTPVGTPAPPDDAPPSVKATSAARRERRHKSRTHINAPPKGPPPATRAGQRLFPTVEYRSRVSYFDPRSDYTNFRGFFVLFWIGLAIMVITSMLRSLRETGSALSFRQWPLFVENIWELGVSDVLMCGSTAVDVPLQWWYKSARGLGRWQRGGVVLQSAVQAVWLWVWIGWPFYRDWTWTAQVFFTLHTLTLFMKMHSYAFYCGHLSATLQRLQELDMPLRPTTPTTKAVRYPPPHDYMTAKDGAGDDSSSGDEQTPLVRLRDDLAKELTSPLGNVSYPANLTLANFGDFLFCPTLCYEIEFPRNPTRSYMELFYKVLAVFGCIFLLTITSEEFIIPVLDASHTRLRPLPSHPTPSTADTALILAETVSHLLFPFMVTFLLVFLVIFEYVLGAFAEITRFADRQFYSDWWNSLDWLEFSREWNIPVHNFFRRHVYSASRGVKLSRPAATAVTFFISALAHELVMGCITRKFRGYGFVMMMLQMPLVVLQRLPWVRDRVLLNNVMFWISMIMGLSSLCALYVLV